jgi:hypothetical protein
VVHDQERAPAQEVQQVGALFKFNLPITFHATNMRSIFAYKFYFSLPSERLITMTLR